MKTVAYLRVSTGSQDQSNQKLAVLEYARQKHFAIDQFIEVQVSTRKSQAQRRIEELLDLLKEGDRLVVSELSRLGRSLGQVIHIVEELVRRKILFVAIKETIRFEGKQDMQTKVMIALFGLFAEVERDLISERTKEGKSQRAFARAAQRGVGKVQTGRQRGRDYEAAGEGCLKIVDRQDCRGVTNRFVALHPLAKARSKGLARPIPQAPSLEHIFAPIWSVPFQGRYHFTITDSVLKGDLRPLRTPDDPAEFLRREIA